MTLKAHQYVVFSLVITGGFQDSEGEYIFFCMGTYIDTFSHEILFDVKMADCTNVCISVKLISLPFNSMR